MFDVLVAALLVATAAGPQPLPEAPEPVEAPAREELVDDIQFTRELVLEAEDPLAELEKEYREAMAQIRREEQQVYLEQLAPLQEKYTYEEDFSACYRHVPDAREQIELVRQEAQKLPGLRREYNQAREILRQRVKAYQREKRRYQDEVERWKVLRKHGYRKPSDLELRRRYARAEEARAEVQRIEGQIQTILGKMEEWNRRERSLRAQEKSEMDAVATARDMRIRRRIEELRAIPRYRFVADYLDVKKQIGQKQRRIEKKEHTVALLKEQGYQDRTEGLWKQIEKLQGSIRELREEAEQMRKDYLARSEAGSGLEEERKKTAAIE